MLKTNSLEGFIEVKLAMLCAVILLLSGYVAWLLTVKWQWILIIELSLLTFFIGYILSVKQRIMKSFTRASLHLDAMNQKIITNLESRLFLRGK